MVRIPAWRGGYGSLSVRADPATYIPATKIGAPGGVATLDANKKIPLDQLPAVIPTSGTGGTGGQGLTGPAGPKGDKGDQGNVGPVGPAGAPGQNGTPGQPGSAGPKGDAGPAGATGSVGPQGPIGLTGNTGPQGPKGDTGSTGSIGPQGPAGAASTVAGPQGPKGDQGIQGVKGDTGDTGPQGIPGTSGGDPWAWAKLAADVSNTTVTLANSGLSFTATANTTYIVELIGTFTSSLATAGIAAALDIPSGSVVGQGYSPISATASGSFEQIADNSTTGATASVRAANTLTPVGAQWIVAIGATGGTVQMTFRPEVAATCTLKANLTALRSRAI